VREGIDLRSGYRDTDVEPGQYSVEGIFLPRPFRITSVGPIKLFVRDLDQAERFYCQILGLTKTEETTVQERRCLFLRTGTEHHSLALVPLELKPFLLPEARTTLCSFGLKVADYQQLRDSARFLEDRGVSLLDWPLELSPGVDYSVHALDPNGNCYQLHYYMEQVGWDGKPRPPKQRRKVRPGEWPEFLEPLSDTFADQTHPGLNG
jgi:catechol 2,3-dioxygenase-like lactoylglutathione lyase family enzyme